MLPLLSDELLLEAYRHALRLQLEHEFVSLLQAEIHRRELALPEEQTV
ncbi:MULTISPECIES: sporulation histidine kinase inhibitor Sda [Cohnella]|nr:MULTISPECIES: sporulation histidine kinase inhibitor Sda [Cohnella]